MNCEICGNHPARKISLVIPGGLAFCDWCEGMSNNKPESKDVKFSDSYIRPPFEFERFNIDLPCYHVPLPVFMYTEKGEATRKRLHLGLPSNDRKFNGFVSREFAEAVTAMRKQETTGVVYVSTPDPNCPLCHGSGEYSEYDEVGYSDCECITRQLPEIV